MKTVLWLDDYRNPHAKSVKAGFFYTWIEMYSPFKEEKVDVVWVKNYDEFVDYITTNGLPDGICFDNDLGKKLEGYDCAKWLVNYCLDKEKQLPKYSIQSDNYVAHQNITSLFNSFNMVIN